VAITTKHRRSLARRILAEIDSRQQVTQRSLSSELGIALGLTNLLLRRLIQRGWVEVVGVKPNRVRYLLTPDGVAAKARQTRSYLNRTVRLYTHTRETIRQRLETLSANGALSDGGLQTGDQSGNQGGHQAGQGNQGGVQRAADGADPAPIKRRIVFYGAGEVAEIGYVSLQATHLHLVGVVDDNARRDFFGMAVHSPSCLAENRLNGEEFDHVVIMSFKSAAKIKARLRERGFPQDRIFCL